MLVVDTPAGVVERRRAKTLEEAFIGYLEDAQKAQGDTPAAAQKTRRSRRARQRNPTPPGAEPAPGSASSGCWRAATAS